MLFTLFNVVKLELRFNFGTSVKLISLNAFHQKNSR
jgi:hypothetical protein